MTIAIGCVLGLIVAWINYRIGYRRGIAAGRMEAMHHVRAVTELVTQLPTSSQGGSS